MIIRLPQRTLCAVEESLAEEEGLGKAGQALNDVGNRKPESLVCWIVRISK